MRTCASSGLRRVRGRGAYPGLFLTFEGIEGSGKTTCLKAVARRLRALGRRVRLTCEPGGTPDGRILRRLLLDTGGPIDPETELALYAADRRVHVEQVIVPALRRGEIVLSDRYVDSTRAYQGGGRRLPRAEVRMWAWGGGGEKWPCPELTILLDCPVRVGLARVGRRGLARDRMERERQAFHRRVRRAYLDLAAGEPRRFRVVNGAKGPRDVADEAWRHVEPLLGTAGRGRA